MCTVTSCTQYISFLVYHNFNVTTPFPGLSSYVCKKRSSSIQENIFFLPTLNFVADYNIYFCIQREGDRYSGKHLVTTVITQSSETLDVVTWASTTIRGQYSYNSVELDQTSSLPRLYRTWNFCPTYFLSIKIRPVCALCSCIQCHTL